MASITINYIVRRGDTLWSISRRFGVPIKDIVSDNNIKNPDMIYPGQRLIIRRPNFPNVYIVRRGDTLAAIANRFNTTVAELVRLNNIKNPDMIYPGQRIILS